MLLWFKGFKAILLVGCLFAGGIIFTSQADGKFYAGWLESIVLVPSGIKLRAKLDSGAKTSSIHASDMEFFERDGDEWVRFRTSNLYHKNREFVSIERPLVRSVRIKNHFTSARERPVVTLSICWHENVFETEFTLTERSQFNYPVLLGRSFLKQGFLVDASQTFTHMTKRKKCFRLAETKSSLSGSKHNNKTN